MLRNTLTTLVAIFAMATFALAQETYQLKSNAREGAKYAFDSVQSGNQEGTMAPEGAVPGMQPQRMVQTMRIVRQGSVEILAVKNGSPSKIKLVFDAKSGNTVEANGQKQNVPDFALAGKTITIWRDETGTLKHDSNDQIDQMVLGELNSYLMPDNPMFPKKAVAVGEEWELDTKAMAAAMQMGPNDAMKSTCKLVNVREEGGRKLADIQMHSTMTKTDPQSGGKVQNDTTGTVLIDLETGTALKSESTGKMSMSGRGEQGGVKFTMSGQGTNETRATLTPIGDLPPANVGGNNNVVPNPVGGDNPLGGGGPKFAGTFKDDNVTLTLKSDGEGRYSGTLAMKDGSAFPITATEKDGALSGTFKAAGSDFKFTATLEGGTLKFDSEGNVYTLKKAAANPLGI